MYLPKRSFIALCSLFLLIPEWMIAATIPKICGTQQGALQAELVLHRQVKPDPAKASSRRSFSARAASRDIGDIAIIEDSNRVVGRRNAFNLDRRTLTFLPQDSAAARYRLETGADTFDSAAADNGAPVAGLGDDDSREFRLPFRFPFYGGSYDRLWLNSDGNLTFEGPDATVSDRSLGRFLAGLPRISALFTDLNPPASRSGVSVLAASNRWVVTWRDVPLFSDISAGQLQTFQIRIYPNGRIEFAWRGSNSPDSVVGISPGKLRGEPAIIPLAAGSSAEFSGAVGERFSSVNEIDIVAAAQRFYETHQDAYDFLVFYNTVDVPAGTGAVAFEVTVRNRTKGIGDPLVDAGADFGSPRRLQAVLNMGRLSDYPADSNATIPARLPTGDTPLSLLAHEAGHLHGAYVSVRDPRNPQARPMLGRGGVHWSFAFNSEASFLEGNRIADQGAGTTPRFSTVAAVQQFAPLDQYLMGFRSPDDVPPTFAVLNPTIGSSSRPPQVGVNFNGQRRDVTVPEIIAAEGPRIPDFTVAQRNYRFAFILIVPEGATPRAEDLAKVDRFRSEFPAFFARTSDQRGAAETTLRRALRLSAFPAIGVLRGSGGTGAIEIEEPRAEPLAIALTVSNSFVGVPDLVTIPAGATRVTFAIRGLQPGVAQLTATPADPAFETAIARVQVTEFGPALRLQVAGGNKQANTAPDPLPQPVAFVALDANDVPHAGVPVRVLVSSGGAVSPTEAITDENGIAAFRWTPAPGGINVLEASVPGLPGAVVRADALGRPTIAAGGIVNAASFAPLLAPGGIATLFGGSLAAGTSGSFSSPFVTRFGDVQVAVNGTLARLVSVSDGQISVVLPADLNTTVAATFQVITSAGTSEPVAARVVPAAPGIFFNTATNEGAILVANTGLLTSQQRVQPGGFLEIYTTGLGAVNGDGATVVRPEVTIGGLPAPVLFSGRNPLVQGLYQVNVQVPAGTGSGPRELRITAGGQASNTVLIFVQ
ncbi:MAG: hypothetical protein K2X35_05295 [Bryobacteraceae bacterium]|nr:hypothetical protein [Bryobacteraceae bacterium]